ncbi:MAG TPA: glycosyltransferase family 2 protein, partial [Bryobacteraceae bacterium]|nr:glycosyltransferase family 2 protein [Bryobacteraceae bacterium]
GYAPDAAFEASFLAPGAVLFCRPGASNAGIGRQLEELRAGYTALSAALLERCAAERPVLDAVSRQHDVLEEMLHSRIWRTLCSAGAIALRGAALARGAAALARRLPGLAGAETVHLSVDEVVQDPRSAGGLYLRGWALARSGIDRVEVAVDGAAPVLARTGPPRPDVSAAFPRIAAADRAGFEATVCGPAPTAGGGRLLSVRGVSRSGKSREAVHRFDPRRTPYDCWIAEFERRDPLLVPLRLRALSTVPLISIVVPVYNPDPRHLESAIASVRRQGYPHWELCLACDGPVSAAIEAVLARAAAADPRIRRTALAVRGGISAAANAALTLARGGYVAFLDDDDELAPDALLEIAEALERHPDAGFLYSDEDKISIDDRRYDPFFKPDWSPDLLLSENYVCHLLVARRDLVETAGGLRSECDGAQDHDLILRLAERTASIVHIPKVLYHWRACEGSAALESGAKPEAACASLRAVEQHLARTGRSARVEPGAVEGRLRVRYAIPAGSRVTIIIPSGGNARALAACLDSLHAKTLYRDYEVLVIDNSRGSRIERIVSGFAREGLAVRSMNWPERRFNYSAMNNAAARECTTPLLLFLNDDTRVIAPEWLEAMVELGTRTDVGAVGARLLYPDGRIQHAGVIVGLFQHCGHAFRGLPGSLRHYFDFPDVIRNVGAVTAACMLVRSAVFKEAGGFDEARFPIAFNDVDLCLRLAQSAYRIVYTPHASLYHDESLSRRGRRLLRDQTGVQALRTFWRDAIAYDPFYSPNLTCTAEDYTLRKGTPGF